MKNFGLIGAAGFVAPRHLKAIADTGNKLVAAVDPNDSVGILDRYFPETKFFTEIERFDRFLEKRRKLSETEQIQYVSICSPNYLHDAHVRLALRVRAHAICEKPLVINPWNLDALAEIESENSCKIYNILQLRYHKSVVALKEKLESRQNREIADVCLTYITRRGPWYNVSWKGSEEKSGGIVMNIGIHFFDLLIWLFGQVQASELHLSTPQKMAGLVELEWARVKWFLSSDIHDLPNNYFSEGRHAYRSLTMDGQEIEFSDGFSDLHTRVYEDILAGRGLGIDDARPSIDLVYTIRQSNVRLNNEQTHPYLRTGDR